jgi:hypothetical protein
MPFQPAAILFPDVELLLTGALRSLLTAEGSVDVYVSRSVPTERRSRMVIVNRDGGAADGFDHPRVRVRVWDATPKAANDLARLVVALMPRLINTTAVTNVEHLSGPYEIPDEAPDANQRYLLFQITTRGVDL